MTTVPTGEMSKAYVPAEHEARVRARWADGKCWQADPTRVDRAASPTHAPGAKRPPYCVLIPPPNVTGALHLGHALNNTIQDVLTRAHRMKGYEAMWMPGTDHAGIATQAVVEKRLRQEGKLKGPLRDSMTREAFVAQVGLWKDEYEARITEQLQRMGASCDWSRQRFTMDEVCARAVREAFFILFKDALIYRGKRLVNWDPALQTAVADDECYDEESDSQFAYLRYPLIQPNGTPVTWGDLASRGYPGAAQNAAGERAWVCVATTRPETYLGDTAVAVSEHDPRAESLRGLFAELPLVGRRIPIIVDTSGYVVLPKAFARSEVEANDPKAEFATGFLKVTPAHDANDYALGERYHQQIATNSAGRVMINVMSPDGRVSDKHGWDDVGDAGAFVGMKFAEARKAVLKRFEELGLLEGTRAYRQTLTFSDRSKAQIEPYLSDQWFCKVTDPRMARAANAALDADQVRFFPERYAKTYRQWHDNIRDWCISRQLWWGHQIPVWRREMSDSERDAWLAGLADQGVVTDGTWLASDGSVAITLGDVVYACVRDPDGSDSGTTNSGASRAWVERLERDGFVRDPDVLDTWFSSALWPLSTLGWPDDRQRDATRGLLEAFNPTSLLSTAREIITLWVSRMVMMNRYLLGYQQGHGRGHGPSPFAHVFVHCVVQDGQGRKMSKSLGNGVDPTDIIESHGADAMRFTLCQMTTQTQDVRLPVQKDSRTGKNTSTKFDLGRNFANKLWNASRFVLSMLEGHPSEAAASPIDPAALSLVDRWMLSRLHATARRVDAALAGYEFSAYAEACYDLLWRDFCDIYLEAVKPTIAQSAAQRGVLRAALETILRLLHPMMPFVTEAIHEHIGRLSIAPINGVELGAVGPSTPLALAPWPVLSDELHDEEAEARFGRVRALIDAINAVRAQHNVMPKRRVKLWASENVLGVIGDGAGVVQTLAGLASVSALADASGASESGVSLLFEGQSMRLGDLADAVDQGTERERLAKELSEEERKVATLQGRLSNPGYIQRAPAKLVEETQSQLDQAQASRDRLKAALAAIGPS
jgi:valyl-tRNA synthetase